METTKSQTDRSDRPPDPRSFDHLRIHQSLTTTELAYAYVFASFAVLLVSLLPSEAGTLRWKKPTLFRSYLKFALPISLISIAGAITATWTRS